MKFIRLLRVKHYLKNLLIFLPIVFGMKFLDFEMDFRILLGFLSFSLMASVVYILNDIKDVDKDRKHPKKKNRPIACGDIKIKQAVIISFLLLICSITLNIVAAYKAENKAFVWIMLLGYLLVNMIYSLFGGKNVPLLDVVLLMSGFVIRVYYGSAISGINVSAWMCLVILSGSFYMGFGKRRNELINVTEETRTVLHFYSKEFLNNAMNCCMTLTIVFYSLWCMTQIQDGRSGLYVWSIPLLMILMLKYSMDVEAPENEGGGDPIEVIQSDHVLVILALVMVVYMGTCLYYIR